MDEPKSVSSQRYTTTSREPGVRKHGVVQVQLAGAHVCEECGGTMSALVHQGEHSPHWEMNVHGKQVLVNCVGLPILKR